jgi:hypothetical protein
MLQTTAYAWETVGLEEIIGVIVIRGVRKMENPQL